MGQDDDSTLNQKVSRSNHSDGIIILANDNDFSSTNQDVGRTALGNGNYAVVGNNNGAATWTSTGAPTNFRILSRQWKIEETGTVGSLNIQFDVGDGDFDVPALLTGSNYLLVHDSDGDADLSDETPLSLTNTSGNLWSAAINFADGAIFSLATALPADATTTTITAVPTTVLADGVSTSTITVQAVDANGDNLTSGGDTVGLAVTGSASLSSVTDNGNGTYTATLTNTVVEVVTVTGTINAAAITDNAAVSFLSSAPGGVINNLSMWLTADAGTSTTVEGSNISSWNDQSGGAVNATQGTASNQPYYTLNASVATNFNPAVEFRGDNEGSIDYLEFTGNLPNLDSNSNYTIFTLARLKEVGGRHIIYYWNEADIDTSDYNGFGDTGILEGHVGLESGSLPNFYLENDGSGSNEINVSSGSVVTDQVSLFYSNRAGNTAFVGQDGGATSSDTFTGGALNIGYSRVGGHNASSSSTSRYFVGGIGEIIVYDTTLSATQKNQIESYLALKYGVTLSSSATSYKNSAGVDIWTDVSYWNDIFGIGQDDTSTLDQKVSRSSSSDSIMVLANDNDFTSSNLDVGRTALGNGNYAIVGNNNGAAIWTSTGAPTNFRILSRQWKIEETGTVGSLNIQFDVGDGDFDVPGLTAGADHYLVHDTDGDADLSDETPVILTNTSGDLWSTAVNLADGAIFSLAALSVTTELPPDATNTTITAVPTSVLADGTSTSTITVQAKDANGHNLIIGGDIVLLAVTGSASLSSVTDNGDGTYTATLTNTVAEAVTITGTINAAAITDNAAVTFLSSGPGGVVSDIQLWLRADVGITESGGSVSQWDDQSGNTNHATQGTGSVQPALISPSINFNPGLDFDGAEPTGTFMSIADNLNIPGSGTFSMFVVYELDIVSDDNSFIGNLGSNDFSFGGRNREVQRTQIDGESTDFAEFLSVGIAYIGSLQRSGSNTFTTRLDAKLDGTASYSVDDFDGDINSFTTMLIGDSLSTTGGGNQMDGRLAEVIVYDTNVTSAYSQQIYSYLAIKYGITLDTTITSYKNSAGADVWTDVSYWNDIFGLGQDDTSILNQKVSKSIEVDAIVTLANDNDFTSSNLDVGRTALGNGNYAIVGNNNGAAIWTSTGAPTNFRILSRQWKIEETGTVGSLNIQFDVGDGDFDVPGLTAGADHYLVHDTDGDADLSDETPVILTNTSGDLWSTAVNLADGAIFSLAALSVTTELPPDATNTTITAAPTSVLADGTSTSTITVQAKDANGHNLIIGGDTVLLAVTGSASLSSVVDNGDGTYTATLTNTVAEAVTITGTINAAAITDNAAVTFLSSGPGGVVPNIQLWLKADAGTSTTVEGSNISSWTDQSGGSVNATQGVSANQPYYTLSSGVAANFNPAVEFRGDNEGSIDYLEFVGNLPNLENNSNYTIFTLVRFNEVGERKIIYYWDDTNSDSGRYDGYGTSNKVVEGHIGLESGSEPNLFLQNGASSHRIEVNNGVVIADQVSLLYANRSGNDGYIGVDGGSTNSANSPQGGSDNIGYSRVGGHNRSDGSLSHYFVGGVGEIVVYDTTLTATQKNQVESYLALKYGLTLDSSAANYKNSAGVDIWTDTTYWNDILGIGQDDTSTLNQKVSRSNNADSIVILANNNDFTSSNLDGGRTALGDGNYAIIGNNNGAATWTSTGAPTNYRILSRQWKIEETGTVNSLNIQFDVGDGDFDVPALLTGSNYLLVHDSDGDADLSDETPVSLTNTSGNLWSSAINFADGAIFSLATALPADATTTTITAAPTTVLADGVATSTITVQAVDANGDNLTSGGDTVGLAVTGSASLSSVTDNGNGTYTTTLTNTVVEAVTVTGTINAAAITDNAAVSFLFSAPGGVINNLSMWLKADAGTSTTVEGSNISSWNDQSGGAVNATQGTASNQPYYTLNASVATNFNPAVEFRGDNEGSIDYLEFTGNLPNLDSNANYTIFTMVRFKEVSGNKIIYYWNESNTDAGDFNGFGDFGVLEGHVGLNSSSLPNFFLENNGGASNRIDAVAGSVVVDQVSLFYSSRAGNTGFIGQDGGATNSDTFTAGAINIGYSRVGGHNHSGSNLNRYFVGGVGEIIVYDTTLTATQKNQVESYLALKYGLTLDSSAATYKNSAGTDIWTDATYWNDVFGIGQDDTSTLNQKVSRSNNADSIIILANNNDFTSSNLDGGRTALGDGNYAIIGNNNGAATWTSTDSPAIFNLLTRRWKIEETGTVGTINLQFDVGDADFDVPSLTFGPVYYLVHDTDGDQSLADETPIVLSNSAGNLWTVAINLADGALFTLATQINTAPTDIQIDAGNSDTIDENAVSGTNIGTLTSSDPNAGDSHTYSLACAVAGADDGQFQISGAQLQSNAVFDFEVPTDANVDGTYEVCVRSTDSGSLTYDENLTITINNLNTAPTDIAVDGGNSDSIDENLAINTVIGVLTTVDDGENTSPTYSLTCTVAGADDSHFNINGSNLRNSTVFDFEVPVDSGGNNIYDICVRVFDGALNYDENLTISVNNVDDTPPATPAAAPDLQAASDTGSSDTDNITNDTTPSFDVVCTEAGSTITLYSDSPAPNTNIGTHVCVGVGTETATANTLASTVHNITYSETDTSSNESGQSPALAVTIDTVAPPAPTVDYPAASGTTDGTVGGSGATPGDTITATVQGTGETCQAAVAGDGTWSCDLSPTPSPGAVTIDATATDPAGNTSTATSVNATVQLAFITTWKTDNPGISTSTQIRIPTTGGGYNYSVEWGDGTFSTGLTGITTYTYASAGTYTVTITGTFPRIYFNNNGDFLKILSVEQWGSNPWTSMANAFFGAANLVVNASDVPDLSALTDLSGMFYNAAALNQNISSWNTSTVTNMSSMFRGASIFNQDISSWNVANVSNFSNMFRDALVFDQNIGGWNVGSATDLSAMFSNAESFNQDISGWNVSNVLNMASLFLAADVFNQDISGWNVSNVTDMNTMFRRAWVFNQDISGWNVGNVLDTSNMFRNADSFDQDLSSWDVSNVTTFEYMFANTNVFNQSLGAWTVSSLTNAVNMLNNSNLSTSNYDATLIGWNAQTLQSGVTLGATNLEYCTAEAARANMIASDSWTINDNGRVCSPATDIQIDGANSDTIDENEVSGTNIGVLTSTDPDFNDIHTYALSCTTPGADDASFQISGSNLQSASVFDFENPADNNTDGTYEICVRSTDIGGETYDENLTITINDLDAAPTNIDIDGGNTDSLDERVVANSVIGTLTNTDDGENNPQSYSYSLACAVAGVDDGHFNILGTSLRNTTVFDFETPVDNNTDNAYQICVRVTETNGGKVYDENLTINVNDIVDVPSAAQTTIDASPTSVTADGVSISTITVQAKDALGSDLVVGGDTVVLSVTGSASLSIVTDNSDGTYTATVTNTVAEVVTVTGTINAAAITDNAVVTFTPGVASPAQTQITAAPTSVTADGVTTSTITVQVRDALGNNLTAGGDTVILSTTGSASLSTVTDNTDGTYTATLTNTVAEVVTITGTLNAVAIVDNEVVTFVPGAADATQTNINAAPATVTANGVSTSTITVQAIDAQGNNLTAGGDTVVLAVTGSASLSSVTDNGNGTYTATMTNTVAEAVTVTGTINAVAITDNAIVTFVPGGPSATQTTIDAIPAILAADGVNVSTITVQVKDAQGNDLTTGGETVVLSVTGSASLSTVTDNGDGTYTATMTNAVAEGVTVSGTLNATPIIDTAFVIFADGPGGVDATLMVWLKADAGVTGGAAVTGWADQSGNSFNFVNVAGATEPDATSTMLNFNPTVTFDGVDDLMRYSGVIFPNHELTTDKQSFYLVTLANNSEAIFAQNITSAGLIGPSVSAQGNYLSSDASGPGFTQVNGADGVGSAILHTVRRSDLDVTTFGNGLQINTGTLVAPLTNPSDIVFLGGREQGCCSTRYDGSLAELVAFNQDTAAGTDKQQIESYLAIKYGITLDSSVVAYKNSAGVDVWTDVSYWNDIVGIGEDDDSALNQKISKSTNADAVLTLASDNDFVSSNQDAGRTALGDGNYIIIGNDDGAASWTTSGTPTGYNLLSRVWKVDETGTVAAINIQLDVGDADFDIPDLLAGTTYFIVHDSDADLDLSDETPVALTNSSGNLWTAAIDFADGAILTMATLLPADETTTTIDAAPTSVTADGVSISTIIVQAKDVNGDDLTIGGDTVVLSVTGSATLSAVTDNGDGSYTATLTNTVAEAVTVSGTINAAAITDTAVVTFVPGTADAAQTTISAAPVIVTANGANTATVTVQAIDASGNNLTSGGDSVVLAVTGSANLSSVTDNGDGTYTATLTDVIAEVVTVTGTINASAITDNAIVTFIPGIADAGQTTISAAPSTVTADGVSTSVITVQAIDALGNNLATGGDTVLLAATGSASISLVTDNGNGSYTATIVNSVAQMVVVTGTINGSAITDNASVNFVPGAADGGQSQITATPTTLIADGVSVSTITVQLRDAQGNNLATGGDTVVLAVTGSASLGVLSDNGNGTYSATLTNTVAEMVTITGTVNAAAISDNAMVTFTAGPADATLTTINAAPTTVVADGSSISTITVQLIDAQGNNLGSGGDTVTLAVTGSGVLSTVIDNGDGTYSASLTNSIIEIVTVTGTVNGSAITDNAVVTFTSGSPDASQTTIDASPSNLTADGVSVSTVTVQVKDAQGNDLSSGGDTVVLTVSGSATLSAVTDNGDGTYTATLTSTVAEVVTVNGTLNGTAITDAAMVTFVAGAPDATTSTISASPTTVTADGTSISTITVQIKDAQGNNLAIGGDTVVLTATGSASLTAVIDNANGTYSATISNTVAEPVTINGTLNGMPITDNALVTFVAGSADSIQSTINAVPASVTADGISLSTVTVQAKDSQGNDLTTGGDTVVLASTGSALLSGVSDNGNGSYTATVTNTVSEVVTVTGTINSNNMTNQATVTFTPGAVGQGATTIAAAPTDVAADGNSESTITVQAKDAQGNNLTSGGGIVILSSTGSAQLSPVTDNNDGTYSALLVNSVVEVVTVSGTFDGAAIANNAQVNFFDPDSDDDGILDSVEGTIDTDNDGIPNYLDRDSDNDGIPDAIEFVTDSDGDGIPNYLDLDSDNDGIPDFYEGGATGNDADGDEIDDAFDVDQTGGFDANGDGVDDAILPIDRDGDGELDYTDPGSDADRDGIPDAIEGIDDADGDGIPNFLDTDADNDGIPDSAEGGVSGVDSDGDGIDDTFDVDQTGGVDANSDGIDDTIILPDVDNDGEIDYLDPGSDADRDGVPDFHEGLDDNDGDGISNYLDTDADNDTIPDHLEGGPIGVDTDGDGIDDYFDVDQTGGVDANNDGIDDNVSPADIDSDGEIDYLDPGSDADVDGVPDFLEGLVDTDGDGVANYRDLDTDNDGILDTSEAKISGVDSDGDGVDDYFDVDQTGGADTNSDGIDDNRALPDFDEDNVADISDLDSDNDSISDAHESGGPDTNNNGVIDGFIDSNGDGLDDNVDTTLIDSDNDGIANQLDRDSDNDSITDVMEAEGLDTDNDGMIDNFADANGDGFDDVIDLAIVDTDNDGIPDHLDIDSDSDGISDLIEGGAPADSDADGNGVLDAVTDMDGDGLVDIVDNYVVNGVAGTAVAVPDTDGDGAPDFQDVDSDGDEIPDEQEPGDDNFDNVPDRLQPLSNTRLETAVISGGGSVIFAALIFFVLIILWRRFNKTGTENMFVFLVFVSFSGALMWSENVHGFDDATKASQTFQYRDKEFSGFKPEWYAGIGFGASYVDPKGESNGWYTDDDASEGYKFYLGYQLSPHWNIELGYVDAGEAGLSNVNVFVDAQLNEPGIKYQIPSLMANYYFREATDNWNYYVKFGGAAISNSSTHDEILFEKQTSAQFAAGLGSHWRFSKNWFIRAELDYYAKDASYASLQIGTFLGEPNSEKNKSYFSPPKRDIARVSETTATPQPIPQKQLRDKQSHQDKVNKKIVKKAKRICERTSHELEDEFDCVVTTILNDRISFNKNSSVLTTSATHVLDRIAESLKLYPRIKVSIEAHTDNSGTDTYNLFLSHRRAIAVVSYLFKKGISINRFKSSGFGEVKPIADNNTKEGREKNRRVEIKQLP
ncbi:invasin domain 3-containing protein [Aliikangiella coralliicola]|uniref:BspA family leucine-rich repeat surface protein n=1 Tax=Aliikangiella coralliicola TaxID=2592383 RepID=A0A545UBQ0_9GAMM|nr:invasin domain 3-containing protein [Aliikangiella coralliicola]TQV86853.1 BspA family leucine-rich repeat surface protein [Aliikangiella coralliicola]